MRGARSKGRRRRPCSLEGRFLVRVPGDGWQVCQVCTALMVLEALGLYSVLFSGTRGSPDSVP